MIRKNFTLKLAQQLALENIADLDHIFKWNAEHDIFVFRISSDLFPHFTDVALDEVKNGTYNMDFAREALLHAGEMARRYNQRISMHPGQYNQVGTPNEPVWEATIRDLTYHADLLDAMGLGNESVICVHGGGVFNDLEKTKKRWIERFHQLPEQVRRRLAIENCERHYSVIDCLDIAEACHIPLIFDCHHFECYNLLYADKVIDIDTYMPRVVNTWKQRGVIPLFHISEQEPNTRVGTHSDYVKALPVYYQTFMETFGDLDVEVEAGAKEFSVFLLRDSI